jgi:hypothetical protein
LVKKCRHSKFAPKAIEGFFLLGYDSNTKAYRDFNKSLGLVEVTSDVVFDETNGSLRKHVDLDENEVPTTVIRTMEIGDVRPQEHQVQDQPSYSTMVQTPIQDEEQAPQDDYRPKASRVPEGMNQGGTRTRRKGGRSTTCTSNPSLHNIQKDHPVDQILSDIIKGVNMCSHIAIFCEHYSFVSSIEPFRVE